MSGVGALHTIRNAAVAGVLALGSTQSFANDNGGAAMTAGVVMEKIPVRERTAYVMGIVEGLAQARFRKDTVQAGTADQTGMNCIYNWFYADSMKRMDTVEAAFTKYQDQFPSTLLYVLIKRECGE